VQRVAKNEHADCMFSCKLHVAARREFLRILGHTASMVSYPQYGSIGHEFLPIFDSVSPCLRGESLLALGSPGFLSQFAQLLENLQG